ncbi:MAG: hypothetical protein LBH22_07350 [Bacteroidales bacterium]|jgi:hypothetical protein|nr:hypothetical protein [Bacteroidales bacterium]
MLRSCTLSLIHTFANRERKAERLTCGLAQWRSHSAETKMEIKNIPPKVFGSPLRQVAGRYLQASEGVLTPNP